MGEIGMALAERARAFEMQVRYFKRRPLTEDEERRLGIEYAPLHELLRGSDFVSLNLPHTRETEKMIGRQELALMKPSAHLINVSRGGIIDEAALYDALKGDRIAGAGLDVFEREPLPKDSPLSTLDNVILTPHSAAVFLMGSNIFLDVRRIRENLFSVVAGGRVIHGKCITGEG